MKQITQKEIDLCMEVLLKICLEKDLLEILEQNRKTWARKIKRFQLQKMAVGVEVATGAFFKSILSIRLGSSLIS